MVQSMAMGEKRSQACGVLAEWPVERPSQWLQWVNEPERESELEDLRCGAQRGRPFGDEDWVVRTARRLGLESTLRQRGRPRQSSSL
jgi:putative transposase